MSKQQSATGRNWPSARRGGGMILALSLLGGTLTGVAGAVVAVGYLPLTETADQTISGPDLPGDVLPEDLTGLAATVQQVMPSVVSFSVNRAEGTATGSGLVIRKDGYILTNHHVVDGARDNGITVVFADGTRETAELIGSTTSYDLAVVKVDHNNLTPLEFADSEVLLVGQSVVAFGAPLGLDGTVTAGIISALDRPVSAGGSSGQAFINAVQTDAAINPGNSGGPLVDLQGRVIGVNSAIAQPPGTTGTAGSIGLGFAIPANQALRTANQLIDQGFATYPVIGVLFDSNFRGPGVKVVEAAGGQGDPVTPDGPAERAGILPGDIITHIDSEPVGSADSFIVNLRSRSPGDSVLLRVQSGSSVTEVTLVLDQATSD